MDRPEQSWDGRSLKDFHEGAQARSPLDCNGKPLTYVAMPQRGRCAFDSAPHFKNEWCFRWYVLRGGQQRGPHMKANEARQAKQRYTVSVYDQAGRFRETKCASFQDALLVYDADRLAYPHKVVRVENPDRVDLGCSDGLTEDEREAVSP